LIDIEVLRRGLGGLGGCRRRVVSRRAWAEKLGDGDQVDAATDEASRERMPERVCGDLLVEVRVLGDASDDVVRAFDRQPAAALVDEQGGGVGAGPVLALLESVGERVAELGVGRDLS
jgi:hypothetical protein